MKALIKVGYGCNNRCAFCHTEPERNRRASGAAIDAKIDAAVALGCDTVVLSGGEPTLRAELKGWARRCAAHKVGFGLVSNGRMLCYPQVVDELLACGLTYAHLSLHGATAAVHDSMVRAEAFVQSLAAIRLLAQRPIALTVNTVVTRANLDELVGLVDLLAGGSKLDLKLSMVEPKGEALRSFEMVVPLVSQAASAMRRALLYAGSLAAPPRLFHEGMPLCLLPGFEAQGSGLAAHGFAYMSETHEAGFAPVDDDNKVKPRRCAGCALYAACPGLFNAYHRRRGDLELAPRVEQTCRL